MSFLSTIDTESGARRARVLMTATLLTLAGNHKVTVRDISRTGAHVAGVKGLGASCDAIFHRGRIFAAAHIIWSSDEEAGIGFYRELTAEEVAGTLPAALLGSGL